MRSSSMLISRARSVRNAAKVPFKFRFDLLIETVDKIAASGDIVVVWERNNTKKVEHTMPAHIDRTTRTATFKKEKISAEVTLFKTQPTDKRFQDKVVKLAVRAMNVEGKTLAKIHINLAEYAEVPSGSKRVSAELSNGSILIATIQCQFLSMGKTASGAQGSRNCRPEMSAGNSTDEEDVEADVASDRSFEDSADSVPKGRMKIFNLSTRKSTTRRQRDDDNGSLSKSDYLAIEKLRKENNVLRKQIDEVEAKESKVDEVKVREEHKALKSEHEELKILIAREPVYEEVVKQLREVKMGLAILHIEKDKVENVLVMSRNSRG